MIVNFTLPEQLTEPGFRFIKTNPKTKRPLEKGWQKDGNYPPSDITDVIGDRDHYGVACGFNNLVVIDFDNELVQNLLLSKFPETFTTKSAGRGLLHLYFQCKDSIKAWKVLDKDKNTIADIQGKGKQVIGPHSRDPKSGRDYEVVSNSPIVEFTMKEIHEILDPYNHKKSKKIDPIQEIRDKVTISSILGENGVDTTKNPTNCPLHASKNGKCLSYDDIIGVWHCFHCDESGNVFQLVQQIEGITFRESMVKLAKTAGIEIEQPEPEIIPLEWEYSIGPFPASKGEEEYLINPRGITKQTTRYNEQTRETLTSRKPMWLWDNFEITEILTQTTKSGYKVKYNFKWDNHKYFDYDIKQMRDTMAEYCLLANSYKAKFGPLIYEYTKKHDIPKIEYAPICGFTKDGWRLPGEYFINWTTVQEDIRNNIEYMVGIKLDMDKAREYARILHDSMSAVDKDIDLAWSTIAPFLYTLREPLELMIFLSLGHVGGDTGKTAEAKIVCNWFWNTLADNVISPDQIESRSRAGEYFSASTFPIIIDDCQNLSKECISEIKVYHTNETHFERKNKEQKREIYKSLCTPLCFTWNEVPILLDDGPFLTRGIHHPFPDEFTPEEVKKYEDAKRIIPHGYLGRAIIEYTKDWTIDTIFDIYKTIKQVPKALTTNRQQKIYKLLKLGTIIFKKVFNIELDISNAARLIYKTTQLGNEGVKDIFQRQIADGRKKEVQVRRGADMDTEYQFKPVERWITSEIFEKTKKNIDGWLYTHSNLEDLNRRIHKKFSLEALFKHLNRTYKTLEYGNHKYQLGQTRSIFVPGSLFPDIE